MGIKCKAISKMFYYPGDWNVSAADNLTGAEKTEAYRLTKGSRFYEQSF